MSRPSRSFPTRPALLPLLIGSALLLAACNGGGETSLETEIGPAPVAAGSLDNSFGTGGMVYDQAGGAVEQVLALQAQADGRSLSLVYNRTQLLLVRQLADGRLDTAWGQQGKTIAALPTGARIEAAALLGDGRALAVGADAQGRTLVLRLLADGRIDTGFASHGLLIGAAGRWTALASLPSGETALVGYEPDASALGYRGIVAKLGADGLADAAFGKQTIAFSPQDTPFTVSPATLTAALAPDGKATVGVSGSTLRIYRFGPDGQRDAGFGEQGMTELPADTLTAISLQNDGRLLLGGGSLDAKTPRRAWIARLNAAGRLEADFGSEQGQQRLILDHPSGAYSVDALRAENDGRIVAAIRRRLDGLGDRIGLVRLGARGERDPSYAAREPLLKWERDPMLEYEPVRLDAGADGRLIVAGSDQLRFASIRLQGDGHHDAGWNGDGYARFSLTPARAGSWRALLLEADGRIAVGGDTELPFDSFGRRYPRAVLARYDQQGRPVLAATPVYAPGTVKDPDSNTSLTALVGLDGGLRGVGTLGNPNQLRPSVATGWSMAWNADAHAVGGASWYGYPSAALASERRLIVAGSGGTALARQFQLWRLDENGRYDPTFGVEGRTPAFNLPTERPSFDGNSAFALARQPDGRLVAVGHIGEQLAVARYEADGRIDAGFGNQGLALFPRAAVRGKGRAVAIQNDGKIVVAGEWSDELQSDLLLARLLPDGRLDPAFGNGGWVRDEIGEVGEGLSGVLIQSDGKIVVGGYVVSNTTGRDILAARFEANGQLDQSFGSRGRRVLALSSGNDEARALQSDGNGHLYLAGYSGHECGPMVLVRLFH